MNATLILAFIQFLTSQAFEVWKFAKQQHGDAIPSWESINNRFDVEQAKIDAEKGKL